MSSVLFIIDDFHTGGIARYIRQQADFLLSEHCQVVVLARRGELSNPQVFFSGCNVVVIEDFLQSGLRKRVFGFFAFFSALSDVYRKNDIDVIHFSETWSAIYTLFHPKTWKIKRLLTFHSAFDLDLYSIESRRSGNRVKMFVKKELRKVLQSVVLQSATRVFTFSRYSKKLILEHFSSSLSSKIQIIPGLIDLKKINTLKKRAQKHMVILNFGRAEPRKGVEQLIQALGILQKQKILFRAFIASPVEYFSQFHLMKVYEEEDLFTCLHLLHKVSNEQKTDLLSMADVFVMPSVELETFGMTIIEALAMGVPVIGTPIGAIPEILGKVSKNLITRDTTAYSIAEKLVWFSSLSRKERSKLREKSVAVVKKHYQLQKYRKQFLKIYGLTLFR